MDQFGVLVESIGFKSQVKSAPMADLKGKTTCINKGFPGDLGFNDRSKSPYDSNSAHWSFVDDLDGIFISNRSKKTQNSAATNGYDDIIGGPDLNANGGSMFDLDSVFKGSHIDDDIFGLKRAGSANHDDAFGDFDRFGMKSNGLGRNAGKMEKKASESDDLIPGFGGSSHSSNGEKSETSPFQQSSGHSSKSFSTSAEDPFVVLERAHGRTGEENGASEIENYLDSLFIPGTQSSTGQIHRSTTEDFVFDTLSRNREGSKVERTSSGYSYSTKKAPSVTNTANDFSFLFGMGASPSSTEFQEIQGESEERRRARLNHHIRTEERMAKVLNEKNQRDLETQREQEERHRLAEILDDDIKRWAAGKEGNLRALLSSLQYVLWTGSGWQPVSLTDLITSTSVKKVYYKATLCVHPDKVQQKGANLQQKYIAEKVFDLLKEAWNKFNTEELKKQ